MYNNMYLDQYINKLIEADFQKISLRFGFACLVPIALRGIGTRYGELL